MKAGVGRLPQGHGLPNLIGTTTRNNTSTSSEGKRYMRLGDKERIIGPATYFTSQRDASTAAGR